MGGESCHKFRGGAFRRVELRFEWRGVSHREQEACFIEWRGVSLHTPGNRKKELVTTCGWSEQAERNCLRVEWRRSEWNPPSKGLSHCLDGRFLPKKAGLIRLSTRLYIWRASPLNETYYQSTESTSSRLAKFSSNFGMIHPTYFTCVRPKMTRFNGAQGIYANVLDHVQ